MSKKNGYSRRDFLKVVGAASGVAAVGCTKDPVEKIIPYLNQPDEVIPGVAVWYSGFCGECSSGCGTLVRTREGRAVKLEGNPIHPVNTGGLCAQGQAALQGHYDPDRIRQPLIREGGALRVATWKEAIDEVSKAISSRGEGSELAILTSPLSGSTQSLVEEFVKKIPRAEHFTYELSGSDILQAATDQCFGSGTRVHFDFSKARTILSVGADYHESWVSPVSFSRDWAKSRRPNEKGEMSYCVHIEPRLSLTAGNADRWLRNAPGSEGAVLLAILKLVFEKTKGGKLNGDEQAQVSALIKGVNVEQAAKASGISSSQIEELATVLSSSSSSLVVAGGAAVSGSEGVSAVVVALTLNKLLGNIGNSVILIPQRPTTQSGVPAVAKLIEKMSSEKNKVGVLIVSGVNPAFNLPTKMGFTASLSKVGFIVSVSSQLDETTTLANVVLPLSTNLESWNDSEPFPGSYGLNQPAMQPLYQTQSLGDSLISIASKLELTFEDSASFYDYIQKQWKKRLGEGDFETKWQAAVERGGEFSSLPKRTTGVSLTPNALQRVSFSEKPAALMLLAYPSVNSFDGQSANKPWMQELPNPVTTIVWSSWVEIHPETAKKHHLRENTVVTVRTANGEVKAPIFFQEHIHPNLIAIPIGQGHEVYGRYAAGVGANPLRILNVSADANIEFVTEVSEVITSPWKEELVKLQGHDKQYQRGIVRSISLGAFSQLGHKNHESDHGGGHEDLLALGVKTADQQMYRQMDHPLYRWGMSIDLATCTGCSACVVACYAENNVPVVGRELCAQGREMSWLKIERFFDETDQVQPVSGFLPMLCQHCGNAPCEPVCPVYATYHNEEGLNAMVYNRCVGTRYCANNCSYKVRRFNWFKYDLPEPLTWQLNPDVTVREVGVMEKCTFCVQRVREGRNTAKNLGREVKDGEISPACASSCPTQAITFGNLKDENAQVSKNTASSRAYRVFDSQINTQPAISYLARVRNTAGVSEGGKNHSAKNFSEKHS